MGGFGCFVLCLRSLACIFLARGGFTETVSARLCETARSAAQEKSKTNIESRRRPDGLSFMHAAALRNMEARCKQGRTANALVGVLVS